MPHPAPFVVIAEFRVKPGRLEAFLEAASHDASSSLADEPGCRRFDVVVADGSANVVFYEIYDDRAAFEAHLKTPHLARFREAFPPLIEAELPVRFGQLWQAPSR